MFPHEAEGTVPVYGGVETGMRRTGTVPGLLLLLGES